ncbi:DUF302 domain-containing protein [Maribacter sp.]|nr:DUF302 domain-containing protein [Maribacter sp.]
MKMKFIVLLCFTVLCSCKDQDDNQVPQENNPPNVLGMDYTKSTRSFEETYTALISSLSANENIKIIAEVDHTLNAESVSETLNPTRIVFFGNPNLGTPLMQQNQLAGLDLPQKIVVYKNSEDDVYLGFNNTTYLSNRHDLNGVATLPTIQGALENLSKGASQDNIMGAANSSVTLEEGILLKTTDNKSFDDVYAGLKMAIDNNPNLKIIAELDHQANAEGIGEELSPTKIIIFGNPNLGTPLMQNAQTTALDLPQKMLVWQRQDGPVNVSYNDPAFLMKRHGITENESILETISTALDNLSNAAIAN